MCDTCSLRGKTFRVAWEHRCLSNIVETEVQHDNAFHTNTAAGMGWAAETEGLDVSSDFGNV